MSKEVSKVEQILFNSDFSSLHCEEISYLFEQYKLYVEMTDKISERRHQANSFFLTANTVLITLITSFISLTKDQNIQHSWIIFAAVSGIVFCLTWRYLIISYGQLNSGKFRVIHLLESKLPVKPFDAEWEALNRGDGKLYRPFTQTEIRIPLVFAFLYTLLALCLIISLFR